MLNEVLAGRFRITGLLGSGGMGRVWAAEDERMRRDVAVKVVHPQFGMDEAETQARFQREVQLAGRLAHRNIVTVHDWGEASVDGRPTLFLVMELVQGESLQGMLKASTPGWPLAVLWAAQIAEALHAAHRQGVVHRDIKPANALLTPEGTVKVLDFGIAKFMGETIGAHELTVTGTPVGSPPYMSPEQADGDKTIDHRSDLYSLGCLLYHAVTGRPPFTGSNQWAVLRKQMEDAPEPPASRVEGLPAPLNDLILTLLAKAPGDRPADAATVYESLGTLLADHAVTDPGGDILDVTQLGHTHWVSGRILKRARELLQWTEWNNNAQREGAEQMLRRARTDTERLLNAASMQAQEATAHAERLKDEAAEALRMAQSEAEKIIAEASEKARGITAERLQSDAVAEGGSAVEKARVDADELLAEARRDAGAIRERAELLRDRITGEIEGLHERARREAAETMQSTGDRCNALVKAAEEELAKAQAKAEELVSEANSEVKKLVSEASSEAGRIRIAAVKKAEGLLKEVEHTKVATLRESEDLKAEAVREARSTVEGSKRELEILDRRRADMSAEIDRLTALMSTEAAQWSEESYYRVFKQSIDGDLPSSDRFRQNVEATYGIALVPDDAVRMVTRFANRLAAELEADHIA
ncbi:protein kinase [Streptomyces sp. NPDC101165]|uniref:serine/threonine-protein kinase n=1 Tax=Streptomyces sp. NPDC101165 TaxID=3366119 RepID=UPI0037FCA092